MKRYRGALAKPFDELKLGFGVIQSEASLDRVRKQLVQRNAETMLKTLRLLDHFGIESDDPNQWERLALALAKAHVPGFQERRKPGAKRKWNVFDRLRLKDAVDRQISGARKSSNKGVAWACKVLAKQEPWETLLANDTKPVEVLRHNYYEVKREIEKAEARP